MPSIEKDAEITVSDRFDQMPVQCCQDVVSGRFYIFEDPNVLSFEAIARHQDFEHCFDIVDGPSPRHCPPSRHTPRYDREGFKTSRAFPERIRPSNAMEPLRSSSSSLPHDGGQHAFSR